MFPSLYPTQLRQMSREHMEGHTWASQFSLLSRGRKNISSVLAEEGQAKLLQKPDPHSWHQCTFHFQPKTAKIMQENHPCSSIIPSQVSRKKTLEQSPTNPPKYANIQIYQNHLTIGKYTGTTDVCYSM